MKLAVIFDMDGLMLDTEPISLVAWQAAASELGYELDIRTYDRLIGLGHTAACDLLRKHFGQDCPIDALSESAMQRYRASLDAEGAPLKPGLDDLLHYLEAQRIPRAVATSTETELARDLLRLTGILDRVDLVVGGDEVESGKPAPDIFLRAATRLGHAPHACIVLEDSGPGIRAAAAAGMRSILVPDGRPPAADAAQLAYAVVESLIDAKRVIERLVNRSDLP
jgi:HAD superfamily hydrolase (TIGR01509 family)